MLDFTDLSRCIIALWDGVQARFNGVEQEKREISDRETNSRFFGNIVDSECAHTQTQMAYTGIARNRSPRTFIYIWLLLTETCFNFREKEIHKKKHYYVDIYSGS